MQRIKNITGKSTDIPNVSWSVMATNEGVLKLYATADGGSQQTVARINTDGTITLLRLYDKKLLSVLGISEGERIKMSSD